MAARVFHNTLPDRLAEELAVAARLGILPIRPGAPGFVAITMSGTAKWAVLLDNTLVLIPKVVQGEELARTVLTDGAAVLAAGEVEIVEAYGSYFYFALTNHSGHYQPDRASRKIGVRAFADAGIEPR